MTCRTISSALDPYFLLFLVLFAAAPALAQTSPDSAVSTQAAGISNKQVTSLGDVLRRPGNEPLHILYTHGIGATGAGDSQELRESICKHIKKYVKQKCTTKAGEWQGREYSDEDIFDIKKDPPKLAYMGTLIWGSPEEWHASAPFVDHYVIKLTSGKSILVDEINWWPMVIAVKCQHMMPNETSLAGKLSGKDDNYLSICSKLKPHTGDDKRFDSYDWVKAAELKTLKHTRNRAVPINRWAKVNIMDWRFSDALLVVGPLEGYLVEGIRQLLMKCIETGSKETTALTSKSTPVLDPHATFIIVSHSLGSFLMFSAVHAEYSPHGEKFVGDNTKRTEAFHYLLGHLSQAYFFANQIPLLELAKLGGVSSKSFLDLTAWSCQRKLSEGVAASEDSKPLGQIVAWSDPNDLLTWFLGSDFQSWQAPPATRILIVNHIVKNATKWFWLLENPESAHDNYAKNPEVIRSLLQPLE
jgi:hypothetical protein